jgi:hypothetical protein
MSLDELLQQFEQFAERARIALSGEVAAAKKIMAPANAETGLAQAALSDVQSQTKLARDQLDAVNNELGRRMTLAAVNREIVAVANREGAPCAGHQAARRIEVRGWLKSRRL